MGMYVYVCKLVGEYGAAKHRCNKLNTGLLSVNSPNEEQLCIFQMGTIQ